MQYIPVRFVYLKKNDFFPQFFLMNKYIQMYVNEKRSDSFEK